MTAGPGAGRRARFPLVLSRTRPGPPAPTWRQARPAVIDAAVLAAAARPTGNWYVLAGTRDVRVGRVLARCVGGQEVIAWRGRDGAVRAGPGACPHLGAPLARSRVCQDRVVCHWHGLVLDGGPFAGWEPYPVHDDGVLVWCRLDAVGGEDPWPSPRVPDRPDPGGSVDVVTVTQGACEPQDVVANRLDPWHGAWFHPYAFADLTVDPAPVGDDGLTVRVAFKVAGRLVAPVEAVFTAPGPRTVVMRITDGEGTGSVVETHATPLTADSHPHPSTAVIEAVVASSHRRGFSLARRAAPVLRPLMAAASARLWRDDMAYAERRHLLRRT